jgi:hypothetical protein
LVFAGVREAGAASVAFDYGEELEKLGHRVELQFIEGCNGLSPGVYSYKQM